MCVHVWTGLCTLVARGALMTAALGIFCYLPDCRGVRCFVQARFSWFRAHTFHVCNIATHSHVHSPTPGPSKAVSAFQRRPSAKDLLLQGTVLDAIAQFQTSTWKVPPVLRVLPHQTRVALLPGRIGP